MNLHILTAGIYGNNFIRLSSTLESFNNQLFIVSSPELSEYTENSNLVFMKNGVGKYLQVLRLMMQSDKVFFHGLFNPRLKILYCLYYRKAKFHWIIWGGDLYQFKFFRNTIKDSIQKKIDKFLYPRISNIITLYDFDIYDEIYNKKSLTKNHIRAGYFLPLQFSLPKKREDSIIKILIGNSATETNNHISLMNKLVDILIDDFEILCPLTYGDNNYKDKVISVGNELFGSKFKPIIHHLPYKDYLEILKDIDAAIFFHDRQQGVGNIIQLLALGKKVYIKSSVTTFKYLTDIDLKVFDALEDMNDLNEPFHESVAMRNISIIKDNFSFDSISRMWIEILN